MRVVVLGAGYAGLTLASRLESSLPDDADLTVADETGTHLIQHELHRVVRRPALAEQLELPLSSLLERASVRWVAVEEVDSNGGRVVLGDGTDLFYDVGAVCIGAATEFYDLPGVREVGTPLKRVEDARRIRGRFLEEDVGRVVVGGAGLSGIQVAGELAALADERDLDREVVLLEQEDAVAPGFGGPFQAALHAALVERGVDVRTGTTVAGADEGSVAIAGGDPVPTDQLVWTGGIRGREPLSGERPTVRSDLRLADRTFALGDAARIVDENGAAVPATAQAAIREGRVTARNVTRLVEADPDDVFEPRLEHFAFEPRGWVVSVGDAAVAEVGGQVLRGRAARAVKLSLGAGYLASVGAVSEALDVVYEELGLTT